MCKALGQTSYTHQYLRKGKKQCDMKSMNLLIEPAEVAAIFHVLYLQRGSSFLIVPLLSVCFPEKVHVCLPECLYLFFLSCVWGLRITVLSTLAEFLLAAGMPGTLCKLGRAQRPHLTYPLMCLRVSDGGSEKECLYITEK